MEDRIYILKSDVLDRITEEYGAGGFIDYSNYSNLWDSVDDMPAADVQHGDRWISVKDRLPKSGQNVLIYYPKWDGDEIQVARLDNDGMTFDICGEFNVGTGVVTHWMPLPESPRGGDTNG